jgi:hypothetical protein
MPIPEATMATPRFVLLSVVPTLNPISRKMVTNSRHVGGVTWVGREIIPESAINCRRTLGGDRIQIVL